MDAREGVMFQPDTLPDAGGAGVITAVGVEALRLLSSWYHGVALIILYIDSQGVFSGGYIRTDLKFKGSVPAGVFADRLTVDIDEGLMVDAAKVQAQQRS